MGMEEVKIAPHSPWQNPYCERVIGSIRRECLNDVIVLNEQHLKRLLRSYVGYYHTWRTHRSLAMDAPEPRVIQPPEMGPVEAAGSRRTSSPLRTDSGVKFPPRTHLKR